MTDLGRIVKAYTSAHEARVAIVLDVVKTATREFELVLLDDSVQWVICLGLTANRPLMTRTTTIFGAERKDLREALERR